MSLAVTGMRLFRVMWIFMICIKCVYCLYAEVNEFVSINLVFQLFHAAFHFVVGFCLRLDETSVSQN